MTEPTRGTRARRGNRRPGSLLLTALLVLAIVASSALVFTNKVELLKLAVIVALWAAVVAAFVSFIYRRQSDVDQAKSRDLKLVYDLQLDREISARREYELSIETHLRRELASELRAQSADEVASLRAELAALRANLEIIFDTDLQSRPAIETERTTVHRFGDWDAVARGGASAAERGDRSVTPGRVISSRIDTEAQDDTDPTTEESPIIDVPAEPQPPDDESAPQIPGGAHRRPSERDPADAGWRPPQREAPRQEDGQDGRRRPPEPVPNPTPVPETRLPWMPVEAPPTRPPSPRQTAPQPRQEPERIAGRHAPSGSGWRPAPAEGQFIPAGAPGSNWASSPAENGASAPVSAQNDPAPVAPPPPVVQPVAPTPAMTAPPSEPPRPGRHYTAETSEAEAARRARHSAPDADPDRRTPPTLASPPPAPEAAQEPPAARHRGSAGDQEDADDVSDADEPAGQHIGGQPVSELMARLQVGSTGGGRRRRREE